jgi:hypothetical protein
MAHRLRRSDTVSATRQAPVSYARSTKNNLTGLIIAEEKYEKDIRILDTGRLYAVWRDRLRSFAGLGGRDDEFQEKEQEETQTPSFYRERYDREEEIAWYISG